MLQIEGATPVAMDSLGAGTPGKAPIVKRRRQGEGEGDADVDDVMSEAAKTNGNFVWEMSRGWRSHNECAPGAHQKMCAVGGLYRGNTSI